MKASNKKITQKSLSQSSRKIRGADDELHNAIKILLTEADDYLERNKLKQANLLYQQVVELEPENIFALNGLGRIALNVGMLLLAVEFFNAASSIDSNNITVNQNLGLVYKKLGRYDKAIQHYIYLLNTDINNDDVHGELANLYLQVGDIKSALKHYRSAFKFNPGEPKNFQGMVQLDARSITADNINTVENYLLKPNLPLEVRCSFYFSLAEVYDSSEKYDEAFANYSVANLSKIAAFDAKKHTQYVTDIIQAFSQDVLQNTDFKGNDSAKPVFIVGMPQSGITSFDQLLASHSDIVSAGELNLIDNIAKKLNLEDCSDKTGELSIVNTHSKLLHDFSRFYLNHITAITTDENHRIPLRIIDKMPTNFLHLGLISLLFPKAKIIHCVGNPLDICLSNYFKNFSDDNIYSYDQKNIALYYQQYDRLMAHWKKVLPVDIHTVDYENMMLSSEATSRELFGFIGIDWQPGCIESYISNHHAKTDNLIKLKRDTYKLPVQHWRNYKRYAHSMIKDLTLFNAAETPAKAANAQ